ncbi:MAG: hypothetical protein JST79_19365 [Acidobacteria bacterium]|nr:hypothetical protein [Acidobacteriota bacterium]
MDRRRHPRVSMQLPVKVWGVDAKSLPFSELATAINISEGGLVLQRLRRQVRLGTVLEIQYGHEQAQFKVVRLDRVGNPEQGSIGLEKLAAQPTLMDLSLLQGRAAAAAHA